jgi:hypothetical protein
MVRTVWIAAVLASLVALGAQAAAPAASPPSLAPWPAPPDPLARAVHAGLKPERKELLVHHVHSHLDVFLNGTPVLVPAGIGINIRDPGVQRFSLADGSTAYGRIEMCGAPCISPLHTHARSGILHTESASAKPHTLGQFFVEWAVKLSATCVGTHCGAHKIAVYVNGRRYTKDPRTVTLTQGKEIAIIIGTPPRTIPATADFSQL